MSTSEAPLSNIEPGGVADIPSLRKIQETLVEVGDKPQPFIGSREWIGSFEACIILDHLFGVGILCTSVPCDGWYIVMCVYAAGA